MNKKEMLERFQLVYAVTDQIMQCVILGYATLPEKTKAVENECLRFVEICTPFRLAMQKEKLPANNKTLIIALDILLAAKDCVRNENVFDEFAQFVVKTSAHILTDNVKKLAFELDKYSK